MIIIDDSVIPTLGVFLRWQFDEYTMFRYYEPETIIHIFAKRGYNLVGMDIKDTICPLKSLPFYLKPLSFLYDIPARFKKINQERCQIGYNFIFKKR